MTNLGKIQFTNTQGYTETFLYHATVTIGEDPVEKQASLDRIVSMCRFVLTDDIPSDVKKMRFYYTGGSGAFNALTGLGSVNSKQTVKLDVAAGQQQFEVYTIPHDETGTLKMTITALDASGNTIKERVFEGVPVRRNAITTYSGNFFDDVAESEDISFGLKADGAWEQGEEVAF
jgi:hypothetical protein